MADSKLIKSYSDIPGFFMWVDRWVFATLLGSQVESPPGTLVELGVYQGKSAVIIGDAVRPGERFVAVDVFGREDLLDGSLSGEANRQENRNQYRNLTREQFETNYLALHPTLPEIVEGLSATVLDHVQPDTARFIHIDAGHLYDQVHEDIVNARTLLRPGGIIAFDDYRTEHTPGVSAAIWQAVFEDGLIPVAVTPQKLYGVYDDPEPYLNALRDFVANDPGKRWWMQEQQVLGRPLLRIKNMNAKNPAPKTAARALRPVKTAKPERTPTVATSSLIRRAVRVAARDYAPPALTRWAVTRRKRRSS